MRGLAKLDVGIGDDLDAVAPGIDEVEKRPVHHARAGGLRELTHPAAVVNHQPEMPLPILVRRLGFHQRQKPIAEIDEGLTVAAPAQAEVENASIEGKRLLDVTDFKGDVIDANEARQFAGHGFAPGLAALRRLSICGSARRRAEAACRRPVYCRVGFSPAAASVGVTCLSSQSAMTAAISRLFFSSMRKWPLPRMPISASRMKSTGTPA